MRDVIEKKYAKNFPFWDQECIWAFSRVPGSKKGFHLGKGKRDLELLQSQASSLI